MALLRAVGDSASVVNCNDSSNDPMPAITSGSLSGSSKRIFGGCMYWFNIVERSNVECCYGTLLLDRCELDGDDEEVFVPCEPCVPLHTLVLSTSAHHCVSVNHRVVETSNLVLSCHSVLLWLPYRLKVLKDCKC